MPDTRSWNVRLRLALVCAMFAVPLILSLWLYGQQVRREFEFNAREVRGARLLREEWPQLVNEVSRALPAPAPDPALDETLLRLRRHAANALILDDHAETYPLAHALTSDLLRLTASSRPGAAGFPARTQAASEAASDLSTAAAALPQGPEQTRLQARVDELRRIVADPQQLTFAIAERCWMQTLADLYRLLELRREHLQQRAAIEGLLVAALVLAAFVTALSIARGLSRRVALLVAQIDRLIANDTKVVTPFLADRFDIGRLAKGVEALRQAQVEARSAWGEVLLNEMRYALLAENMREVVLVTDHIGVIDFASPSAAALAGGRDLGGASIWDLFAAADVRDLKDALATAKPEITRLGCLAATPDADIRAWDVTIKRSSDDEESLVFVVTPQS